MFAKSFYFNRPGILPFLTTRASQTASRSPSTRKENVAAIEVGVKMSKIWYLLFMGRGWTSKTLYSIGSTHSTPLFKNSMHLSRELLFIFQSPNGNVLIKAKNLAVEMELKVQSKLF